MPVGIWDAADPGQFQLYFLHLAGLDDAADRAVAAGNTAAAAWRSYEQRLADLTPEEGALLKEVAYGCNQALSNHDASVRGQTTTAEEPLGTRMEIVSAAIDELHAQLGDLSFDKVVQRVKALFANLGTVAAGGPGPPTPVTSAAPAGGDLGPPVDLDVTQPHTDVWSEVLKLDEHTFLAECATSPQDDLTIYYYLGGLATNCLLSGAGIGPFNVQCGIFGTAYCSATFNNVPGQSFTVRGLHAMLMRWDFCDDGFGNLVDCLRDPLHYGSPPGTTLPDFLDGQRIYAPGGPPAFWLATYPNNAWLIAATHSTPVTLLNISPRQVTLYPGGEQHFSSNIPAKWWNFGGKGTLDVDTGVYKAPDAITSEDTDTFEACDAQFSPGLVDCVQATVTLKPLKITITPATAEVLPDTEQHLDVTLTPGMPGTKVDWSIVPQGTDDLGSFTFRSDSSAGYKAPLNKKLPGPEEVTVKACVTPVSGGAQVCGTAKLTVPKILMFIAAPKTTLLTYESEHLLLQVLGSGVRREVDWTPIPIEKGTLAVASIDSQQADYTAPPKATVVDLNVCLRESKSTCNDPFRLTIVEPLAITSVTGTWNAGEQASPFSISGKGFGDHPVVSFEGLQSTVLSATDSLISGVAVIPVALGGGSTRVTVLVHLANGDEASTSYPNGSRIPIVPVGTLAINPATAELRAGESQTFSAVCLTAQGAACSSPETVRWSASPGSIAPTTGASVRYTAPASVPSDATATITACWSLGGPCAPPAHVTLRSGSGVTVTVNPSTATVLVGHTQPFTATVAGSSNTQVSWSLIPQTPEAGGINSSGVYSAPAALGGVTTVTVVATSQADGTKSGTATVTLAAPPQPTLLCTPSPAAVNYGSTITWTCTASGDPATLQYALFRQRAGTTSWIPDVSSPAWQASNVLTWTPAATDIGTWGIVIWVRDGNTPASMNGYGFAAYCNAGPVQVTAPAAPLTVTGTASPPSADYGTTLGWTAYASGGTPGTIQYAFFRRKVGTGSGAAGWIPDVTQPAWQPGNAFTWTPSAGDAGTWETYVWVRDANTSPTANGYGFAAGYNPGPVEITVPLSQVYPAKGWVDGYDTQHIWGWACDPDYPDQSNRVDFYTTAGQPLGSTGAFLGSTAAIAAQCLGGYAHYFDFYPPGGIPSGTHFNAWSIDLPYATPGNDNRRCGGNGSIGDGTELVIP